MRDVSRVGQRQGEGCEQSGTKAGRGTGTEWDKGRVRDVSRVGQRQGEGGEQSGTKAG